MFLSMIKKGQIKKTFGFYLHTETLICIILKIGSLVFVTIEYYLNKFLAKSIKASHKLWKNKYI